MLCRVCFGCEKWCCSPYTDISIAFLIDIVFYLMTNAYMIFALEDMSYK